MVCSLMMVFHTKTCRSFFNVNFNANLILFLKLFNCASVGEKTLMITKMHGMYVKISVTIKIFSSITTTNDIKCSGLIKIKFPCYGQSPSIHNESRIASERRKQLRK
jgi:hypothetical protein